MSLNINGEEINGDEIIVGKIQSEAIGSESPSVNEILRRAAIQILHDIDSEKIETIQINTTKYEDHSKNITIEISYPSRSEMKPPDKKSTFLEEMINRAGEGIKIDPKAVFPGDR